MQIAITALVSERPSWLASSTAGPAALAASAVQPAMTDLVMDLTVSRERDPQRSRNMLELQVRIDGRDECLNIVCGPLADERALNALADALVAKLLDRTISSG